MNSNRKYETYSVQKSNECTGTLVDWIDLGEVSREDARKALRKSRTTQEEEEGIHALLLVHLHPHGGTYVEGEG